MGKYYLHKQMLECFDALVDHHSSSHDMQMLKCFDALVDHHSSSHDKQMLKCFDTFVDHHSSSHDILGKRNRREMLLCNRLHQLRKECIRRPQQL